MVACFFYSQAAEKGGSIGFGVPSFKLGEFLFELGSPDAVGIVEVRLGIEGILLLHDVPKHRVPL